MSSLIEEDSILREILVRTIAVETELRTMKDEIKELKSTNKEFSERISKITLDYHQARGAIQLANWIALAVIALTAGLGSVWLSNINKQSNNNYEVPTKTNPQKP